MPKLKQTFIQGKMNKDLDERLLPNGQYRDALNIQISTSEGSDVGAIENVLGNAKVNKKSSSPDVYWNSGFGLTNPTAIGVVADSQNNKIYWFLTSDSIDAILEYDKTTGLIAPVLVDANGVLNFSSNYIITGVNVFEGLLAWTDDLNEPRIIDIDLFKSGSAQTTSDLSEHTEVYSRDFIDSDITVIKQAPKQAPTIAAYPSLLGGPGTGITPVTTTQINFNQGDPSFDPLPIGTVVTISALSGAVLYEGGETVRLTASIINDDNTVTEYEVIGTVSNITGGGTGFDLTITSISSNVPNAFLEWEALLIEEDPIFKNDFPRFSYRWKYEDGRYSLYAPFSEVAFVPGEFKYVSASGFNSGMDSIIRKIDISGFETPPADVVEVEILYKGAVANNVYVVENVDLDTSTLGTISVTSSLLGAVIENSQLLRLWDNVPRKAKAQEIIGNRLVYGNYVQGYNVPREIAINTSATNTAHANVGYGEASVKSDRAYQVGVTFLDKYNRETPVFTNSTASVNLSGSVSKDVNTLTASLTVSSVPSWATHFKYYVKEPSQPYYNLALDRFYDAFDGNVWLSFPSSERNKIVEGQYITLKKKHDSSEAVLRNNKYKVLDISNEAPDFISTDALPKARVDVTTVSFVTGINEVEFTGPTYDRTPEFYSNFNSLASVQFEVGNLRSRKYKVQEGGPVGDVISGTPDVSSYNVVLTEQIGSEDAWLENLGAGQVITCILYNDEKQNLPEFQGRFFAKINRNSVFDENVAAIFESQTPNVITDHAHDVAADTDADLGVTYASTRLYWDDSYGWPAGMGFTGKPPTAADDDFTLILAIDGIFGSSDDGQQLYESLTIGSEIRFKSTTGDYTDVYTVINYTDTPYTRTVGTNNPWKPARAAQIVLDRNLPANLVASDYAFIEVVHERATVDTSVLTSQNPAIFETVPEEMADLDIYYEASDAIEIADATQVNQLSWFNCYSFGQGVESDRIRDDFNTAIIGKGVKVSSTIKETYQEERKGSSMIFSGLLNSTSGVNMLNQFSMAQDITKDLNPTHGTIQKLHARDTDLTALCEDKLFRILANKDALYNADGNVNITASKNVLGQAVPYAGEYGISKNPESFASFGFRAYFTDKQRGAVIRLSRDGVTEISNKGMERYFGDKLESHGGLIVGSFDTRTSAYILSLAGDESLAFKEKVDGWSTRLSFVPEAAVALNQVYYTFKNGEMWAHDSETRSNFYGIQSEANVKVIINEQPSLIKNFKTVSYEGDAGWKAEFTTNEEVGYIDTWLKREGIHHNYISGKKAVWDNATHTGTLDTTRFSVQGIGGLLSATPIGSDFELVFSGYVNVSVSVNDPVFFVRSGQIFHLGSVVSIAGERLISTNDHGLSIPVNGEFVFVAKDNEKNTSGIRGYYAEAVFKTTSSDKKELFAVNPNVFISSE